MLDLKKVGEQMGSNEGGIYEERLDGQNEGEIRRRPGAARIARWVGC